MKHVTDQSSSRNDYTTIRNITFNIGNLKSIDFSTDYGKKGFTIKTYNDTKSILIDPDGYTRAVSEFLIEAEDLGELAGQAERFLKAWRHAMTVCGAKEEKF